MFNPLNKYLFPGLEAVDFQMNSKLGSALTELFQSVIDYRDNLDYGPIQDPDAQTEFRISKTYSFFKDKIVKKFMDVVEKESGLIVKKIHLDADPLVYGVSFNFATTIIFDSMYDAWEMISAETASDNVQFSRNGENELTEVCNNLDLHKSKLTTSYFGKGKKRRIDCEMWFSVSSAFLIKDLLINDNVEELTAREIAAIMMHEIGHMMSIIEHSSNMYHSWSRAQNWLNISKDTSDLNYILASFDKYKEIITSLQKSLATCNLEANSSKMIDNLLGTAKYICTSWAHRTCEEIQEESTDSGFTALTHLVNPVAHVMSLLGLVVTIVFQIAVDVVLDVTCLWTLGLPLWLYHFSKSHNYVDRNKLGNKSSDTLPNANNVFLLERWADEFVARHGFGADVATALNKLDNWMSITRMGGQEYSYTVRNSGMASVMIAMARFVSDKINFLAYCDPVGYENQYQRNLRLLQDMYGVFRDKHLEPTYRDHWFKQIDQCKQAVADAKKMLDTDFGKAIANTLTYLVSPAKIYHLLADANLAKDVQLLEDRLNDFHNNPLYYLAARLRKKR